ncbi:DUF1206 domain-containing protein [Pontibacter qinzhouensis]|uniref:DUF1206 domain-containing protein n=1 Tax=Pontibacter qinzhouensis TaxID=2603253 RepID=A0A5C8KC58_9BACT|nr:DUF1206 domain-containing protein [Pontibacter qinzhouensis]TXK47945.1 DUF1206 domain-containing protein [Pontibacter qinzhouensis]
MAVDEKYRKLVHQLARFGCFSIGLVYLLIGVLANLSLFRLAQPSADEERIMDFLLDYTIGEIAIWIVLLGMICYIIWRVFEAITDPYEFGSDMVGILKRVGVALSGAGYGFIAFSAIDVLLGNGGNSEEERQLLISQVLAWPGGNILVGCMGAITAAAGLVQFWYVINGDYRMRIDIDHMEPYQKRLLHLMAWAGYFARGIILLVLAYFMLQGALKSDPDAVGDTDSAFDFLGGGFFGDSLFFLVATGTICYGLFMFIYAIYYKFEKGWSAGD